MTSLYVIQGNDQGRHFTLPETTATVGRDPSNDIQLRDAEVSRYHARIVFADGSYRLIDEGSVNGVFVNGKRSKNRILRGGDQLLLGQTLLLFANQPPSENLFAESDSGSHDSRRGPEDSEQIIVKSIPSQTGQAMFHTPLFSGSKDWSPQADAHLKMMYHTTLVTSQTLNIDILLNRILDLIFEWVRIDRGCILLFDPATHQLVPRARRVSAKTGGNDTDRAVRFSIDQSIVSYVLKRREGVLTNDAQNDPRYESPDKAVREIICAPMLGRYGLVGIIYIDTLSGSDTPAKGSSGSSSQIDRLTSDHLRLMIAIAHQAALAVEDTRYYKGMIKSEQFAAIGRTVSTLSHHIKNILQGINGASHLIRTGLDRHDEDMIRQGWTIVERNQTRISQLILDMLTFSKEREPAYELGDLGKTIEDVVELMRGRAGELGVELDFEAGDSIPPFFFDSEQIHRAVTNVVTNALDAAGRHDPLGEESADVDWAMETLHSKSIPANSERRKGVVQVALEFESNRSVVRIRIDDNGPGIPPDRRATLFQPFYSEKRGRGTGLGLPVAAKVVREHGGRIRITDSPLGGARFLIDLPFRLTLEN